MHRVTIVLLAIAASLAAATGDYTSWMGPNGGRAIDSGVELVDSHADAKFVWEAELKLPIVYTDPQNITRFPITHYCLPSVADGLVYYVYPSAAQSSPPDEVSIEKFTRGKKWDEKNRPKLEYAARLYADDIVTCIDADTGKTKWQRIFAAKGANNTFNSNYYAAPVVADGKVYILGSWLWVYCLDAKTGETVWESELADSRAAWLKHFEAWLAGDYQKTLQGLRDGSITHYKEHYVLSGLNVGSPVLAGGVLVCNDAGRRGKKGSGGGANSLVGLDAATGKQVWKLPGAVKNGAPPQRWVHEGRELVICAAGDGFRCIDPQEGKQLWAVKAATSKWGTFCVGEDHLVAGGGKRKEYGMVAWRLTPTGAEELWKLPKDKRGSYTTPAIYKGHVFGRGGNQQKQIIMMAVELATGKIVKETKWAGGNTCNSPVIADGRMWFSWEDYLNVDPESPDFMKQLTGEKRNPKLKRNGWASASVAQGRVFYRQGTRLMCADFRKK